MKNFLKNTLASFVGILLFTLISLTIVFGIIGAISTASQSKSTIIKANTILYMKLDKEIVDRATDNPFENFNFQTFAADPQLGLNQILNNLDKAKKDENIKGIFMELSYIPAGFATVEEIRDALIDFKTSGKFIYTYADILTQNAYYLASVSDKIYMNPTGTMEFKGLKTKSPFFKHALEKLGLEPIIFRHGKYKSAVEPFMYDQMSADNKKQTSAFIQSIWDHLVLQISEQRNISVEKLNQIADDFAIRNPKGAAELGIIDAVKYRDEVIDELAELTGAKNAEKIESIKIGKYTHVSIEKKGKPKKDKVAVVYASGNINMGKGDNQSIGSETISKAIRTARRDSSVKAIVLRVNSGGGSALASDIIWREAVLAQKVKPFIVSMGDVAASGGYYIACPADTIVASEVTITGSIGVFGLLLNTQKLMNEKLGITFDGVKTNKLADLGDVTRPMSEAEKEIIQGGVEEIYSTFITQVGEGRQMTPEAVDEIGQGRVWSGANAKEIGLVDVFGGLTTAISIAAEKAGVEDYRVVDYPIQPDPMEELIKQLTGEAKIQLLKRELGDAYSTYKQVQEIQKMEGVQARMPMNIEIY